MGLVVAVRGRIGPGGVRLDAVLAGPERLAPAAEVAVLDHAREPAEVVDRLVEETDVDSFYYHSDLWARVIFNFAVAYKRGIVDQTRLLESLIPFYHSRVLSFVNKTLKHGIRETEEYLENIIRVFEAEKYYLIKRWDESRNNQDSLLFE